MGYTHYSDVYTIQIPTVNVTATVTAVEVADTPLTARDRTIARS